MSEPVPLYVTNGSDELLRVSYAYRWWEFKPGVPTAVPEELARFVFGHGEDDKLPAITRLGFAATNRDIESGLAHLAQFAISAKPPSTPMESATRAVSSAFSFAKGRREPPVPASA